MAEVERELQGGQGVEVTKPENRPGAYEREVRIPKVAGVSFTLQDGEELARRLADSFESDLLLEGADENPFLERFYQDPRTGALPTQLFFLFQRARQMQSMRQADMFQPVRVADFLIEKDRLFAELTLDPEELKLYDQVYEHVTVDAPVPDLVIYLQAPVDILLKRIELVRHPNKISKQERSDSIFTNKVSTKVGLRTQSTRLSDRFT